MVSSIELYNLFPAGCCPGHTKRKHDSFCTGEGKANHIYPGHQFLNGFGQLKRGNIENADKLCSVFDLVANSTNYRRMAVS